MFKFQYQNGKKFPGLQNGVKRGLQIGAGFRDYKFGQEGLQIGVEISNQGKKISNQGSDYKSLSQNTIILQGFFHPR